MLMQKNYFLFLFVIALSLSISTYASATVVPFNGRLAVSADGNEHDPDDIAGTPLSLAILEHAGLKNKLVYYGYNDHVWSSLNGQKRKMTESALTGASKFGFSKSIFYSVVDNKNAAYNALAAEINKSTASNPLYILAMGPIEAICQSVLRSNNNARKHVRVISQGPGGWNNKHQHNNSCTAVDGPGQDIRDTGIIFVDIENNDRGKNTTDGLNNPYSMWTWLKNHKDPNLRWVHDRFEAAIPSRADPSDAGMMWYMITGGPLKSGDQHALPEKLRKFFNGTNDEPDPPTSGDCKGWGNTQSQALSNMRNKCGTGSYSCGRTPANKHVCTLEDDTPPPPSSDCSGWGNTRNQAVNNMRSKCGSGTYTCGRTPANKHKCTIN